MTTAEERVLEMMKASVAQTVLRRAMTEESNHFNESEESLMKIEEAMKTDADVSIKYKMIFNILTDALEQELKEVYAKGYTDGQKALAEHIELCKEEQESESETGHWIRELDDMEGVVKFYCDKCGEWEHSARNYCPNCGNKKAESEG